MKNTSAGNKIWMMISSICLLCSCEHDTQVKLPSYDPMLVVYAYVRIGQNFEIAVSKTMNTLLVDLNNPIVVNNATVTLYENGILKDTLEFDSAANRYLSTSVAAVTGSTYKVIVQAPGFKAVEASAMAPSPMSASLVSYKENARVDQNGIELNDITFRINDPVEKNYYLAEIHQAQDINNAYDYSFCVYSYDPAVEQYQGGLDPFQSGSCIGNKEILITDKNFNGTGKDILVSSEANSLFVISNSTGTYRPYLKTYTISQEYYNYLKGSINIDQQNGNPFIDPFMVKGNVKNGYGLFTIFSSATDTLK